MPRKAIAATSQKGATYEIKSVWAMGERFKVNRLTAQRTGHHAKIYVGGAPNERSGKYFGNAKPRILKERTYNIVTA